MTPCLLLEEGICLICPMVYSFPEVPVPKSHKVGRLKQKFILLQFRRPEVWNQGVSHSPSKSPSLLPLALVVLSNLWCSLACGSITPICASVFTWPCSSAYLCPIFPLPTRIPHIGSGTAVIQYDLILTWLHLQRPCFQIRLHSQVQVDMNFSEGGTNQPSKVYLLVLLDSCSSTCKISFTPSLKNLKPFQHLL